MTARILQNNPTDLTLAMHALARGELVAMPTETVYGLAGLAHDSDALLRIFAAKDRPTFDPLIVHVAPAPVGQRLEALNAAKIVDLRRFTKDQHRVAQSLLDAFWPGPLTLVLPKAAEIPDLCTAGLNRVGVRMPAHPLAQKLLQQLGKPLAAPSANRFGRVSPTTAQHVLAELGERIDWILDGGACDVGLESTVLSVEASGMCTLLRPGGIATARIEALLGQPLVRASQLPGEMTAPGQLSSHYAPSRPIVRLEKPLLGTSPLELAQGDTVLVAEGDGQREAEHFHHLRLNLLLLSPDGTDLTAARRLFALLRDLDAHPTGTAFIEPIQRTDGLWPAIADRLQRASAPRT